VSPFEPFARTAATALLAFVAIAACYLPARCATRIDPAAMVRDD